MLILAQEGPPLAPFREALMEIKEDDAAPVQEDSAVAVNAAISHIGSVAEQLT